MASVIDTFLIQLGFDAKDYKKGVKDAESDLKKFGDSSEKNSKQINEHSKALAVGFSRVRNELIGVVSVAMGAKGVKDFFTNMVTWQANLARVSRDLNMSARDLDAWGGAVKVFHGTAEQFQQSMQGILGGIEAYKHGEMSPSVHAMQKLGIAISDADGKARPLRDLLLDISDSLQGRSNQEQIFIAKQLGIDEGTLNLLRQGRTEVSKLVAELEKASGVTDDSTAAAEKAQKTWAILGEKLSGVGKSIFATTTPAMESINQNLDEFGKWTNEHKDEIAGFFKMISELAMAAGKAVFEFLFKPTETDKKINEWISNTGVGRWLGEKTAMALASIGNKEAAAALTANGVPGYEGKGDSAALGGGPTSATAAKLAPIMAVMRKAEGGYNSVNRGQNGGYKSGTENLEGMTVAQVMAAQSAGKFNAAGQYQIIGTTLKDAVKAMGLSGNEKFDAAMQDRIFSEHLIKTKRPEIMAFLEGKGSINAALKAMSLEWASFTDPQTGRSHYEGVGNNRASVGVSQASQMLMQARANFQAGNSTSVQTTIGQITVNTRATDARGIAADLPGQMQKNAPLMYGAIGMR